MGAKAQESVTSSFPLGLAVLESPHLIPSLLGAGADISSMFKWDSADSEQKSATMLEVAVESAIASRCLDVVKIVLRLGAPVNRAIPDANMPSALQLAVTQEFERENLSEDLTVELVQLLLKRGADIHIPDFLGFYHIPDDFYGGFSDAVRMTLLHSAEAQGRTTLVKALVCAGADVNERAGEKGFTAFQVAARFGNAEMVSYLIKSGANTNVPQIMIFDKPTLVAAVAKDDLELVSLLLQTGADPNITGMIDVGPMLKMTALQTASCQPESLWSSDDSPTIRLEMVKLLLDAGADPKTPRFTTDTEDRSPLAWAVFSYDTDVVKLLLDHSSRCFNLSRA
ncbi:unnamed protein product [Fusarium graminearum]|uniref:Uncharacterized protein n=1 Tax=Gibberella zeae TaxID=5518 RepID=A0A2H3FEQ8_GIBZA|nr:hypothetical protein FGRA07_06348 [Fusarium graminearum]CAF3520739.1 unnamed protein product [Fusarium graminearum]CAF3558049.1 unnamed protein product [Fusarium graminearum]CAG1972739.1 unnamed protein product [Fusarium graminearum]CAG1973630.1 unnamed protein product [Fusarium graminearum]